jgi:opacity protein-like surface antigen
MKRMLRSLALLSGSSLGLFILAEAGHGQNFYLNADAGIAFGDDVEVRQFLVPLRNTDFELDPGGRFSVAGGYNFNEFIGVQIETGMIFNDIDKVSGGGSIDGSLGHVPLIASVVGRYDKPNFPVVPFAGIGLGGDISILTLDNVRAPNGALVDGSGSDLVFAWQAFVGARYKLNDNMSIGGAYKFFAADGASWDVEDTSGDIKSGTACVHSFGVDFNLKF